MPTIYDVIKFIYHAHKMLRRPLLFLCVIFCRHADTRKDSTLATHRGGFRKSGGRGGGARRHPSQSACRGVLDIALY